jgi:MerR family transcriptional regulator, thiopeptide resistance regulator
MFKVSEFAERAGVTVRTLHHYDRLGLLRPSGRTEAGYRLYADRDFARLQQIVTLKFIGLALKEIKELLDSSHLDISAALRLQKQLLQEKRRQVGMAIQAIEEAERSMSGQSDQRPDLAALKKIIEVMERQNNMEWTKKYYSPEAQASIAERAATFTPEMQAEVTKKWNDLFHDIEMAMQQGEDPGSAKAKQLAQRWVELLKGFTGGNPEVQKGLNSLYADKSNWPKTFEQPFKNEVWGWIKNVMAANGMR